MGSTKTAARAGIVAIIVLVTVGLRMYRITAPVADWHSFRQADTASVARIFVSDGIDPFHPRYHDLSNIQSGHDNPQGWRMVEFPLYQSIAAGFARALPFIDIDVWLRLVTVASAAGTTVLIVSLLTYFVSFPAGVVAGLVYATFPYSVYYGRSILPETFAVFWAMLSLFSISRYGKRVSGVLLSSIAGTIAILVKPTAGFLLFPVPYFMFRHHGISRRFFFYSLTYLLITLVPFMWWRNWIMQYPEGIPVYEWLLNKDNIRFKGAWFRWIFAERLGNLILGYWGLIPFGIGMLVHNKKQLSQAVHVFGFGGLLYVTVFAAGNVQHDYYQIILLPIISMYVGVGLIFIVSERAFSRIVRYIFSAGMCMFMLMFSWYTVRTYYWINRPAIIEAGIAADRLLPPDAKVIASYNGDTTFLYQTKRSGWPLGFDIDEKIAMGATHYVTVSPLDTDFETKELAEKYTVMVRNDTYAIIDLTKPRKIENSTQ